MIAGLASRFARLPRPVRVASRMVALFVLGFLGVVLTAAAFASLLAATLLFALALNIAGYGLARATAMASLGVAAFTVLAAGLLGYLTRHRLQGKERPHDQGGASP